MSGLFGNLLRQVVTFGDPDLSDVDKRLQALRRGQTFADKVERINQHNRGDFLC